MESKENIIQAPENKPEEDRVLTGREGLDLLKASTAKAEGIQLKDFFETPEGKEMIKIKKIVLSGPAQSGKTCMRAGLKSAIIGMDDAPYPLFLQGCPDGEPADYSTIMNNNPELAAKIKAEYKSKFTPEFAQVKSDSVRNLSLPHNPLNFIDIGGKITPENELICKYANGAIILSGQNGVLEDMPGKWKEFFTTLGIPVIAEIYSDYTGKEDMIEGVGEDGVFRGSVHYLDRKADLTHRETLKALGEFIINLGKEK